MIETRDKMKPVILVLDTDSGIAKKIDECGQIAIHAHDLAVAKRLISHPGLAVSRVLINPVLAYPAGIPLFKMVLEQNPQASVWLLVEDETEFCTSITKLWGYHGFLTRKDAETNLYAWLHGPSIANETEAFVELSSRREMLPLTPAHLDHPDPLRFGLFFKTQESYILIAKEGRPTSPSQLKKLGGPYFYVIRDQVTGLIALLEGFEQFIQSQPAPNWREVLRSPVSGPFQRI